MRGQSLAVRDMLKECPKIAQHMSNQMKHHLRLVAARFNTQIPQHLSTQVLRSFITTKPSTKSLAEFFDVCCLVVHG